jgi:hypothetical protein
VPAPDRLISAIARYRDWPVGEFAVESVEMTLLDLRLDYPEPEVLAKMPLKKELVSKSALRLEKAACQLLSKGSSWALPRATPANPVRQKPPHREPSPE